MDRDEVADTVRALIIEESGLDDEAFLQNDTDLAEAGVVDSLFVVVIVTLCQERFDCDLELDELIEENFRSVSAVTDLLMQKVGAKSAG